MSDLFHEDIPTEYIVKVGRMMEAANWHTYQISPSVMIDCASFWQAS